MPIETVKKSVSLTRRNIRQHWSTQERRRRREMAELMQRQLLAALGGKASTC